MRLRGRFTLTLALAALVPISVAAVVTRQVIAARMRSDYENLRRSSDDTMRREISRLSTQVEEAVGSLASRDHPYVAGIVRDIIKKTLDKNRLDQVNQQGGPEMRGLGLDVLTLTSSPDHKILVSAHTAEDRIRFEPDPRVYALVGKTKGTAYFAREKVAGHGDTPLLVAVAARLSTDKVGDLHATDWVAVLAGRRVSDDLLASVRSPGRVDARVVRPTGEVELPPAGKDWAALAGDPPIRIELPDDEGKPIAIVEVAVSNGDLDSVLRALTYTSAGLALAALGATVLVGLLVARRTARDLDALVEGSLAASRGDLDHRVPVRSKDEVGAVASAFNFMMEDLRTSKERLVIAERIAAWQEIARRLAHEIKNPLTPIQMAMDTLRKTWRLKHPSFDEILEESTSTVLEEADRLKHIVTEFSDFARMPKPNFHRIDLNEVVRSALSLYHGAVAVELKLTELPQLDADKGQVNQVVLNLVENARDAIGKRADGKIVVSTQLGEAGDRALLVIEDNGQGVPSELKDKVFAPYFTTKHAKGGTGLGLAIVHRIVSDHGGRIQVSDAPGGGARFVIELPLRNGAALLASRI
ncbi:MAG: integral rane sensor signal transduction histidine kinase [Deltaproteobacteria bacterium]|nr:integral rane sensor signal transduction histidine kinase [Deltaproteobacteria bacterium]